MKLTIVFLFCFLSLGITIAAQTEGGKTEPVKVGQIAPDFTLPDQNGNSVQLSRIGQPVMLVFYRGWWCPFCVRQLAELRALLTESDKIRVYAISVDPAEKSKEVIEKIAKDGKGKLPFPILSDAGHQTIDAYGVFDPAYIGKPVEGIPHPAIYILDKDRRVLFAKVEPDYKKRPTNAELRVELDKLK